MREIKFRAWSKYSNEMLSPHDLWKCGFYLCPSNGTFNAYGCDPDEPNNSDLDSWGENENLIPMQFTGLKDKNGKEIYEGDIVKTKIRTFEIKWSEDFAIDGFYGWVGFDIGEEPNGLPEKDYEVIGNTYENTELLNG